MLMRQVVVSCREARAATGLAMDFYGDAVTHVEDDDYPEDFPPDVEDSSYHYGTDDAPPALSRWS